MQSLRVGFIGAGNMAQALAKGFVASGIARPKDIIASSPPQDQHLLDKIAELGVSTTTNNLEATQSCDVVFLAVKPNVVAPVLRQLSQVITPERPLVTSIAAGTTLCDMESSLVPGARVVRVLPNTPAMVNLGASVYSKGKHATDMDGKLTKRLLESVGDCDEVPEVFLDAISGLSGAGPAYMYLVIEALADGGVKMGLPRTLAIKLAAQTMMGSAKMVLSTGKQPSQLKDEVCSPGGCSIEGVSALENGALRAALINAVTDASRKSALLSQSHEVMETKKVAKLPI